MKILTSVLTATFLASLPLSSGAPQKEHKMDFQLIERLTQQADAIAVGTVKSLGSPPPAWSGVFAAYQPVHYHVVKWLRKPAPGNERDGITVFHPVVAKSRTADPDHPKLLESLFHPGAELILLLRVKDSRFETFDENYGVIQNDAKTQEAVVHALEQQSSRK